MRTNLQVPFAEKDEAKKLGARWDATRKVWYVENTPDMSAFQKWISTATLPPSTSAPKRTTPQKTATDGITVVGSKYVTHPVVCNCPPWEVCEFCRAMALTL